jgi:hypothetical protein
MSSPLIPVSWGELLDKICILEIKVARLREAGSVSNSQRELLLLRATAGSLPPETAALRSALLAVNTRLWRIEDEIRRMDAAGDFSAGFVALARAVYRENDERGRIKRALNRMLQSTLVEEKQYSAY